MNGTSRLYSATGPAEGRALRTGTGQDARAALLAARERTLALARDFRAALGDRHPAIAYSSDLNPPLWELGHVGWFQERWIARNPQRVLGTACDPDAARAPSLLPQADAWFDSSRVAHRTRWELPLPGSTATADYLAATLEQTLAALARLPPDADTETLYFFRLVALHEQMHAEAAVYMARHLGLALSDEPLPLAVPANEELELPAQGWRLGPPPGGFAFDNELAAHEVRIAATAIDSQSVTWARFLPFVEAGGYERDDCWTEEGLAWRARQASRLPRYLRRSGAGWEEASGTGWRPLNLAHAATHLNAHEAEAWCRWAGRRLPSEAEWEFAALTLPGFAWGQAWEWTASAFAPYPGFEPHPYRDYSAPWFGSRRALRGACRATAPALADARYRNFFEPHRNDIFAGLRSCRLPA